MVRGIVDIDVDGVSRSFLAMNDFTVEHAGLPTQDVIYFAS